MSVTITTLSLMHVLKKVTKHTSKQNYTKQQHTNPEKKPKQQNYIILHHIFSIAYTTKCVG